MACAWVSGLEFTGCRRKLLLQVFELHHGPCTENLWHQFVASAAVPCTGQSLLGAGSQAGSNSLDQCRETCLNCQNPAV